MGFDRRDGFLFVLVVLLGVLGFVLFLSALAWAATACVLFLFLLAFIVALPIAIEAEGDGQAEDLGGRPGRQADNERHDDPDVSPTDEFHLLAGEQRIVMHAGAEKIEAALTTEGIVQSQHDDSVRDESIDDQGRDGHRQGVQAPDVVTEEAMEARPVTVVDVVTGVDEFGDKAMANGQDPTGHEGTEEHEAGFGKVAIASEEQCVKVFGKMSHGRPSLAWEFGNKVLPIVPRGSAFYLTKSAKLELSARLIFRTLEED